METSSTIREFPDAPTRCFLNAAPDFHRSWLPPARPSAASRLCRESDKLRVSGNQLYVGIPRSLVKEFREKLRFKFRWADNVPLDELKSPAGFMDHGDVAPNARYNYVFSEQE